MPIIALMMEAAGLLLLYSVTTDVAMAVIQSYKQSITVEHNIFTAQTIQMDTDMIKSTLLSLVLGTVLTVLMRIVMVITHTAQSCPACHLIAIALAILEQSATILVSLQLILLMFLWVTHDTYLPENIQRLMASRA